MEKNIGRWKKVQNKWEIMSHTILKNKKAIGKNIPMIKAENFVSQ